MNIKTFSILAIVTALLVIMAVNFTGKRETTPAQSEFHKQQIFPDLALDQVSQIQLHSAEGAVTLSRGENQTWGVTEKQNYPADLKKLHQLLLGVVDLRYLERKTATPELYEKLDLRDVDTADSKAVQLTLKDQDGKVLADFLVGKQKPARMDATQQEIYLRKVGDAQTWLALGTLPVQYDKQPDNWLMAEIANIPQTRIKDVQVTHSDGEVVHVYKEDPQATDFLLADMPDNAKIKSQYTVNNLAGLLTGLRLEDVSAADQIDFEGAVQAQIETFDGVRVTLYTTELEGKHYVKFAATYIAPPPAPAEPQPTEAATEEATPPAAATPSPEEVQQEVDKLNKIFGDWAFVVSQYKINNLLKPRGELISIVNETSETSETSAAEAPSFLSIKDALAARATAP